MPTFGRFQTVDELASSGPFTVYSAREGSGEPVFAIKTFRTQDDLSDPEVVAQRAAAFLAAAKLQRTLADGGARHWAKIHDLGQTDEFAYYVTDLAPLTAQRLAESRRDLDARSLVAIITAAADGLIELRDGTGGGDLGRAHGDLKLSNVLLLDPDPAKGQAVFCDLAPADRLEPDAHQGDIKGLGGLLFELVAHRPPPAANEVRKGPEWDRMGQQGEGLRLVCEQLLNPTTAGAPLTPEEIKKRLAAVLLLKAKRTGLPLPVKIGVGVVVLAAIGAGVWFAMHPAPPPPPPPPVLVDEKDPREADEAAMKAQLAAVEKALADSRAEFDTYGEPGARALAKLTADFNAIANDFAESQQEDWGALPMNATAVPPELTARRDPIKQAHAALKTRLEALPGGVAVAKAGLRLAKAAEAAGTAVQSLGSLLEAGQKRAAALSAEAQADYGKLRERWTAIKTDMDAAAKEAAAFAGTGAEALEQKLAKLTADSTSLDADRKAWKGKFDEAGKKLEERISADRSAFKKSDSGIASEDLFETVKSRFFKEAADYAETGDASEDGYVQMRKKALDAAKKTEELLTPPKIEFAAKPGSFLTAEQLETARRVLAARAVARVAGDDLFTGGSASFDPGSDKLVTAEKAKLAAWAAGMNTLLADAGRIEAMLIDGFGWTEPGPAGATIEKLRAAVADSPALTDLDAKAVEQSSRGKALDGNDSFKEVAAAVRTVVAKADSLDAVAKVSAPAELLGLIDAEGADPKAVARVLAAWKRLAATTYPASLPELDAAATTLNAKVVPAAAKIVDAARRDAASAAAARVIPEMWLALVNGRLGVKPEDVKAAFDPAKMRGWGITTDTPPGLAPAAAYNLERVRFLAAIAGVNGSDDAVQDQVASLAGAFNAKVAAIPGIDKYKSKPEYSAVERQLALYAARKWTYLPKDGPAAIAGQKWLSDDSKVEGDNMAVTYKSPVGNETITFRRVSTGGDNLNFVSTTEVSLGAFNEILAAAGQAPSKANDVMEKAKLIPADYTRTNGYKRDSSGDLRNGPRVWDFVSGGIGPATPERGNPTQGWIASRAGIANLEPAYAPGIAAPAAPSAATPINYISPACAAYVAALAGCRLPTPAEWAAAREQGAPANRRDRSWADQVAHIASLRSAGKFEKIVEDAASPSAGIFLTPEDRKKPLDMAPAVNENDGVLWFAPVSEGGGSAFHHVVGNVGEFVFDDAGQLAALTAQGAMPDAKAYADFARANSAKLKVIGASALSPAAHQPESPLGVTTWARDGYSDVGFRLAFTASGVAGGNLAGRAREKIESMAFLAP